MQPMSCISFRGHQAWEREEDTHIIIIPIIIVCLSFLFRKESSSKILIL